MRQRRPLYLRKRPRRRATGCFIALEFQAMVLKQLILLKFRAGRQSLWLVCYQCETNS
jgi:hypothetical protein